MYKFGLNLYKFGQMWYNDSKGGMCMHETVYRGTRLQDTIAISELVTVHYFEFSKNYRFGGEAHGFWELVYVDSGSIVAATEGKERHLVSGDILFHAPDEWHALFADGINAASVIIISFRCVSSAMTSLGGRVLQTGHTQRMLLSEIIREARASFDSPLSDLVTPKLKRRRDAPIGSEQIIKLDLCKLLITLLREESAPARATVRRNRGEGLFGEVVSFMEDNLHRSLSLEDMAQHARISKTALKQLFKEQAGCGAAAYFMRLKIERAKVYIREDTYNFTQIAERLGFADVHYFSARFKQLVNMSPTAYATSIRALSAEAEAFPSAVESK